MVFDDVNETIYYALGEGYEKWEDFYSYSWNDYLIDLDIGIQSISLGLKYVNSSKYMITDQKKWVLARLKYGI